MKIKSYILIAILAYISFLVATLPAAPVLKLVTRNQPGIEISGIKGTLWQGEADFFSINNQIEIYKLRWDIIVWRLLLAELSADVQGDFQKHAFSAQVSITPTGRITGHDLHATISAPDLAALAAIPLAQLDGMIDLDIGYTTWKQETAPVAEGVINWKKATVTVAETVELGNTRIDLKDDDNEGTLAIITNQGGTLKLDGKAHIDASNNYTLDLEMTPSPSSSKNLVNSLSMFARKQADGSFVVKSSGPLLLPGNL